MTLHTTGDGLQNTSNKVEQRRLTRTVLANNRHTAIHIDTEAQVLVQEIFFLAAVAEANIVECNNRRWQLAYILKVETKLLWLYNWLYKTSSLHLVDNLLLRLGLLNQVSISTSTCNELLDVGNFFLLLVVCFHLVHFVLRLCSHIRRVVTTIRNELLLDRQVNNVCANVVHKVCTVRCKHENMVVGRQVRLQPYDGFQVQVVRWLIHQ